MFVRIFFLCCPLLFFGLFVVGREQIPSFTMDSDRIDSLLGAKDPAFLAQRSPASSDLEFYRRVSLDLCGTIPTVDEAWTFEMNSDPDKRRKMIDHLLGSQAHVFHMAEVLDVWWMERRPEKQIKSNQWNVWLREQIRGGEPLDFIVRDILQSDGAQKETRPASRFFLDRDFEPNLVARDIARLFLGANLQCAQCHDHPRIDDYTQDKYFGLFAFLSRTRQFDDPKSKMAVLAEKADGETSFVSVFDKAKVQKKTPPKLPGKKEITDPVLAKGMEYITAPAKDIREVPRYSRRGQLAGLMAQGGYDPFARNMANRLWAMVMGRGLVHPLDLHHSANPPSHPALMDHLTQELIRLQFDHRAFLKGIVLSKAYQRSSRPLAGAQNNFVEAKSDSGNGWRMMPLRPLSPETYARSILQGTGWTDSQKKAMIASAKTEAEASEEVLQARMGPQMAPLVTQLQSQPGTVEEFDARLDQALFLGNNAHIRNLIASGNIEQRAMALTNPEQICDLLYVAVLTRHSTNEERAEWRPLIQKALASKQPREAMRDMIWALIASAEFRFAS